jgi:hypothetical protein
MAAASASPRRTDGVRLALCARPRDLGFDFRRSQILLALLNLYLGEHALLDAQGDSRKKTLTRRKPPTIAR